MKEKGPNRRSRLLKYPLTPAEQSLLDLSQTLLPVERMDLDPPAAGKGPRKDVTYFPRALTPGLAVPSGDFSPVFASQLSPDSAGQTQRVLLAHQQAQRQGLTLPPELAAEVCHLQCRDAFRLMMIRTSSMSSLASSMGWIDRSVALFSPSSSSSDDYFLMLPGQGEALTDILNTGIPIHHVTRVSAACSHSFPQAFCTYPLSETATRAAEESRLPDFQSTVTEKPSASQGMWSLMALTCTLSSSIFLHLPSSSFIFLLIDL